MRPSELVIKQGDGFKYLVLYAVPHKLPKKLRRKIGRWIRRGQIPKDFATRRYGLIHSPNREGGDAQWIR